MSFSKHIQFALSDTVIEIINSNFTDSANVNTARVRYESCIPILTEHPFGVQFVFRYHIHIKLININVIQNDNINILYLQYTSFKTTVKIKGLKSIGKTSVSTFKSVVARKLSSSKLEDLTVENAHFIGSKITFFNHGKSNLKSKSIMNRIFLSNVCFESSQILKRIFMKNQNIALRNITILDTLNGIFIQSIVNIEDTLLFLRNKGEFKIQKQTNITVNKNSNLIFRHNRVNDGESPFLSIDSNIRFLANSFILFDNNTGSQSGGITFVNTKLIFKGGSNSIFTRNRGRRGGAMAFYAKTNLPACLFCGYRIESSIIIIMVFQFYAVFN